MSATDAIRCEVCDKVISKDEGVFYECPDGVPGHDELECESCHFLHHGFAAAGAVVSRTGDEQ